MKIFSVTWTKWKTSIVHYIDYILYWLWYSTLLVSSNGVYLNWKRKVSEQESLQLYWLVPWRCPWRFIHYWLNKDLSWYNVDYIIVESVIWCYSAWLWYSFHDVGAFTNIFDDHIWKKIKDRNDLSVKKSQFISRVREGWDILVNVNDDLTYKNLYFEGRNVKYNWIQTGKSANTDIFTFERYAKIVNARVELTYQWNMVFDYPVIDNAFSLYWKYNPSLQNLMYVITGLSCLLWAAAFNKRGEEIKKFLSLYKPDINLWRMYVFKIKWWTVILDYAHEKESMKSLLTFSHELKFWNWKVKAVVRLAPDRENSVYNETWAQIANLVDQFYVYDKIDWVDRLAYKTNNYDRKPWEVMDILWDAISSNWWNVIKVIYRKDAIQQAIESIKNGDVVSIIVNDPFKTWEFMKEMYSEYI